MVTLEICMGTSCHLMGTQDLLSVLEELSLEQRQQIDVKGVNCFKNCGKGPNVRINGVLLNGASPESLREALRTSL